MRRPFEADREELITNLEDFVDATFADLQLSPLTMPKGEAFVEYPRFRSAYEVLKRATSAFRDLSPTNVWEAMCEDSLVFVVLRTILGLTPGDWAGLAAMDLRSDVNQNAMRGFDKNCRTDKDYIANLSPTRARKSVERVGSVSP